MSTPSFTQCMVGDDLVGWLKHIDTRQFTTELIQYLYERRVKALPPPEKPTSRKNGSRGGKYFNEQKSAIFAQAQKQVLALMQLLKHLPEQPKPLPTDLLPPVNAQADSLEVVKWVARNVSLPDDQWPEDDQPPSREALNLRRFARAAPSDFWKTWGKTVSEKLAVDVQHKKARKAQQSARVRELITQAKGAKRGRASG